MPLRSANPYTPEEDEIIRTIIETRPAGVSLKQAMAKDLYMLPGRTIDGTLYRWHQHLTKRDLEKARQVAAEKKAAKLEKAKMIKHAKGGKKGAMLEQWSQEDDAILWNTVQMQMLQHPDGNLREALKDSLQKLPTRTFSGVINRYYLLRNREAPPTDTPTVAPQQLTIPDTEPKPNPAVQTYKIPITTYTTNANATTTATNVQYMYSSSGQPVNTIGLPQNAPETPAPIKEPQAPAAEQGPLVSRAEDFIRELYSVVEHNANLREEVKTLRSDAGTVTQLRAELESERAKVQRLTQKVAEMEEDRNAFLKLMDKARQIGRAESGI